MKRWIIACLVIAVAGVMLIGLARRSGQAGSRAPSDEILAYEIAPEQDVSVSVPGNVQRLSVTSWAVLPQATPCDALASYAYAFRVAVAESSGKSLFHRDYFQASRLSARSCGAARASDDFVARLADASDWVSDSRTTEVDLSDLGGRGGQVRLSVAGPEKSRILVRIAFSEQRGELKRGLLAQSLDASKRRLIVERRASLGFDDLPAPAQARGLASWGRRIGALGSKDFDYVERRLLLGGFFPESPSVAPPTDLGMDLDAYHSAALNLQGSLSLTLLADRDAQVVLHDGANVRPVLQLRAGSPTVVQLAGAALRTVRFGATSAVHLRFRVREQDRERQVGDLPFQSARAGELEIGPDVRRQHYFRLATNEPIRVHLAPGQDLVGLTVRGLCQPAQPERHAQIAARWYDRGEIRSAEADVTIQRSEYDRFPDVGDTSDPVRLQFHAPAGATDLEFFGPSDLLASVWTREPNMTQNVLEPAYAGKLAEDEVFRNAPYSERTWAPLAPDNAEPMALAGRELVAAVQVRIENPKLAAAGRTLPERAVLPEGTLLHRELLMPALLGRGLPLPPATWTPLRGPTALRIESGGADARRLTIRYRLGSQPLGGTLGFVLDGERVYEQPLLLATGSFERPVDSGEHLVALEGLAAGSEAYASAAPAHGGAVVKSYNVFELDPSGAMDFQVDQRAGEALEFIVFIATEGSSQPFRLSYTIDDGHPPRRAGSFYRKHTEPSGDLQGTTGVEGSGNLWEAIHVSKEPNPDAVARAVVHLGDDLSAGRRLIRLRSKSVRARCFVRAVLVGQGPAAGSGDLGLWSTEPF